MSQATVFLLQTVAGYVAWALAVAVYILPRLKEMDRVEAQRAIATLHSFRFFGLIFILPGVVGAGLPGPFAEVAAYGDFATAVLAMIALLTVRSRPVFWLFVAAFNVVGVADLLIDYYNAVQVNLPAVAGQLAAGYAIPIIYVPLLTITHLIAFYFLVRPQPAAARVVARKAVAS